MSKHPKSREPLKITILTTSFPRFKGDFPGTFVFNYARQLVKGGCRVRVIAPDDVQVKPDESWQPCEVRRFKYFYPRTWQALAYGAGIVSRIKRNWLAVLQLPFFLASFLWTTLRSARESDLLHAYWSPAALVALTVKGIRGIPVVINLWGSDIVFTQIPVLSLLFKNLMSRANAIICESNSFRTQLEKLGIPEKLITVIPNGIDIDRYQPMNKTTSRQKLDLPLDKNIVLTVGALAPRKGQKYFLEAIPEILASNDNTHFVIVGEGELRTRLTAQINSLNLNGHVTMAGFQEASSIPVWLNAADIFVLPSLLEGNPNVILEAMACGLPVIATTVGGIPGMIRHEVDGLLIPPKSSTELARQVAALIQNPSLKEKLGKNARETIRTQYGGWQKQTLKLKRVYESLL